MFICRASDPNPSGQHSGRPATLSSPRPPETVRTVWTACRFSQSVAAATFKHFRRHPVDLERCGPYGPYSRTQYRLQVSKIRPRAQRQIISPGWQGASGRCLTLLLGETYACRRIPEPRMHAHACAVMDCGFWPARMCSSCANTGAAGCATSATSVFPNESYQSAYLTRLAPAFAREPGAGGGNSKPFCHPLVYYDQQ